MVATNPANKAFRSQPGLCIDNQKCSMPNAITKEIPTNRNAEDLFEGSQPADVNLSPKSGK